MTHSRLRRIALLLAAFVVGACVSKQSKPIGGGWVIVTETSGIPDSGGYHPFLHRRSSRINVRVDTDTWSYRFVPPDGVIWVGMDNGGLWIASGDHEPLLLRGGLNGWEEVPGGDNLDLGGLGKHSLAELLSAAERQPQLTNSWKPTARVSQSPTSLPGIP